MAGSEPTRIPVSTYRLQFNAGFPFAEAAGLAPYLERLGVTECYCSPLLAAKPGSVHGYDVCDHSRINPELGGEEAFRQFSSALRSRDLGLLLDFVPNHMSTDAAANLWWRNVLANGPSSPFAKFFDIDWDPVKTELKGRVLLPVLGDQYGVTLERGELQIDFDGSGFRLRYFDLDLPLNPRELRMLLRHNLWALETTLGQEDPYLTELQSILFHLDHVPSYSQTGAVQITSRQRENEIALQRLAHLVQESPAVRKHIEDNVRLFNGVPGDIHSFDLLHEFLELQPYRLSFWRTATHEINYRRFFDINELAGIRVEEPEAFQQIHALIRELIEQGEITGLRLDHVDGLFDPAGYLDALSSLFGPGRNIYLVVEKILSAGESLPLHWKTHGTTGYEFLNELNGLYVDTRNGYEFRKLYHRFTGRQQDFLPVLYRSKKLIIATSMASELNVLAHELNRISEGHRRFRDFTLDSLQSALLEVVACFPVYRTYVGPSGWSDFDDRCIDTAISQALRRNPAMEPSIFRFIGQMLRPADMPDMPDDFARRVRFAMKFQQYTPPVHAKGVEDTAFYRYAPLLSLNEVGGEPACFGRSPGEFHHANQERLRNWPLSMLTTSTHDSKRGEDARARINVLSEMPNEWRAAISRWARANASARTMVGGDPAPERSDEYLFYQALLGSWPAGLTGPPEREFVDRMRNYIQKALKEKKVHTSWINPSKDYDDAASRFVERALAGPNSRSFLPLFLPFQQRIARFGMVNSLSQLVLKIASPGVPDFYRGSELWDLNLVDPDNRRPVDFRLRERLLDEMEPLLACSCPAEERIHALGGMLGQWEDGRIKLYFTAAGLRLRRRWREVFIGGQYIALQVEGAASAHLVAFARVSGERSIIALAPRLAATLCHSGAALPLGPEVWSDTRVILPENLAHAAYRNILTGETFSPAPALSVAQALQTVPASIFMAGEEEEFSG